MENLDDFAKKRIKDIQEEDTACIDRIDNLLEKFAVLDKELKEIKEKLKRGDKE